MKKKLFLEVEVSTSFYSDTEARVSYSVHESEKPEKGRHHCKGYIPAFEVPIEIDFPDNFVPENYLIEALEAELEREADEYYRTKARLENSISKLRAIPNMTEIDEADIEAIFEEADIEAEDGEFKEL